MELVSNKLSPDLFFCQYDNIQRVFVGVNVIDENQLIHFIKEISNLYELEVDSSLSQQFYDHLPAISSLCYLKLKEKKIEYNFKFIMKMTYLTNLITDQVLISKNINLNSLKYFKKLTWLIKKN